MSNKKEEEPIKRPNLTDNPNYRKEYYEKHKAHYARLAKERTRKIYAGTYVPKSRRHEGNLEEIAREERERFFKKRREYYSEYNKRRRHNEFDFAEKQRQCARDHYNRNIEARRKKALEYYYKKKARLAAESKLNVEPESTDYKEQCEDGNMKVNFN